MVIFAPNESDRNDPRCAVVPETASKFAALGAEVRVEAGAGDRAGYPDASYEEAGARVVPDRAAGLAGADVVLRVNSPGIPELGDYPRGALSVSFLDPFNQGDLLAALASAGVDAISLEMIPRTTLAQKMDALSSQANLAGYSAVLVGATRLGSILPMMMTPAGTLSPARVFVVGVGVAGLQAIATAKRLGARVEAFDTRPVVEEQVKSLGAKFVKIDLGETGQTKDGYARELTPEQIAKQKEGMAKVCAGADLVITTAKLFGRPAPRIVDAGMVARMRPGSVIVDLAAETGGNVEGTVPGEEVRTANGVLIVGHPRLEYTVARHASQMVASNLYGLVEHFFDREGGCFSFREGDEILDGCLLVRGGAIVHPRFKKD